MSVERPMASKVRSSSAVTVSRSVSRKMSFSRLGRSSPQMGFQFRRSFDPPMPGIKTTKNFWAAAVGTAAVRNSASLNANDHVSSSGLRDTGRRMTSNPTADGGHRKWKDTERTSATNRARQH